jgi:hypothetical protein
MRDSPGEGFSVLDGVALVAGAAVASVHVRSAFGESFFGPGWVITFGVFLGVGVTAAGPFLYLVRRYARKPPDYPRIGDLLWSGLGLPWLLSAMLQAAQARHTDPHVMVPTVSTAVLFVGIAAASILALGVIWRTWVTVDPAQAEANFNGPWTNRVGLVLAIAWPIQCGLGMVVAG